MSFSNDSATATDGASVYIAAMMNLLGERDPLTVLSETPGVLETKVRSFSSDRLREPECDGKWSVIEVVQHMADVEVIYSYRLRMVVAHDRPAIPRFDQDLWASRLDYASAELDDALNDFRYVRHANLRWMRSLPRKSWERVGVHAERGLESLRDMVRLCAAHDLAHLQQINRITESLA